MFPVLVIFDFILCKPYLNLIFLYSNSNVFSASYASVLTILSFSLERYLAICTPLYIFPMSDIKRAALVSSLCWTVALLASIPHLIFTKINYMDYPYKSGNYICESAFCAMLDENVYPSVNHNWQLIKIFFIKSKIFLVLSGSWAILHHILPNSRKPADIFLLKHDYCDKTGREK